MLWGKKKKLLRELIFFYGIVNTNVQLSMISPAKNKDSIFRVVITLLNKLTSEVIFKEFKPSQLQKCLERESDLRKAWTNVKVTAPTVVPDEKANYFS